MKTDREFKEALAESSAAVHVVASWLHAKKCDVLIRPTLVRPSFEERNDFADEGDIEIRQRIEVKHRKLTFTSVNDYPYEDVIVDESFKVDRILKGTLWGYAIINQSMTHACLILQHTRPAWTLQTMYDKADRQQRTFYVCPKDLCTFTIIQE